MRIRHKQKAEKSVLFLANGASEPDFRERMVSWVFAGEVVVKL